MKDGPATNPFQRVVVMKNQGLTTLIPSEIYDDLYADFANQAGAHIYIITTGPRVKLLGIEKYGQGWKLTTKTQETQSSSRPVWIPGKLLPDSTASIVNNAILSASSNQDYNFTSFQIIRELLYYYMEHKTPFYNPPASMDRIFGSFFNHKVVYIGQAVGRKKSRSAIDRLKAGHKTFQKILADIHDFQPGAEVAVTLVDANVWGTELTGEISGNLSTSEVKQISKMTMNPEGPLKENSNLVNAAEAMLIRHFQPEYNMLLKNYPVQDAPKLNRSLAAEGVTHLGFEIDFHQCHGRILSPKTGRYERRHRNVVNLITGESQSIVSAPLGFRF